MKYMSPEEQISHHLKQARSAYMMSQAQLARRLGTSQDAIYKLEAGAANPTLRTIKKLADVFNLRSVIRFERKLPGTIQG